MPPAIKHPDPRSGARRIAAGAFLILALVTAPAGEASEFKPPVGGYHVRELTPGACVVVCEALTSMCKDAYISDKNGDCWLVLDRQNAKFTSLDKSCPRTDNQRFTAEMVKDSWRLTCAPEPIGPAGKSKSASNSGAIEKLPDIKPF